MLKKVTLTNVNTKQSTEVLVDTDTDDKAIIGSGRAPNEMAKVVSIEGMRSEEHTSELQSL